MKAENLIKLVLFGGAAYLLYGLFTKQLPKLTAPIAGGIADLWVSLTSAPAMSVQGNVVLPSGQQIPLSSLAVKTDTAGNVYVNINGAVYQLSPSDSEGNWPATFVGNA